MKKFFVLAAVAMIAFAGCKKDESAGMLKVGMEDTPYAGKQTYNVFQNRILFNTGDLIQVNGNVYSVNPAGEGSDYGYRQAMIGPIQFAEGESFLAAYPANEFDAIEGDAWYLMNGMRMSAQMVCDHNNNMGDVIMPTDVYRAWPMVSYNVCGPCVAQTGSFELLNTVAVLSPAIDYSMNWFNKMIDEYGLSYSRATTNYDLPDFVVNSVDIISTNEPLSGDAYVMDFETSNPLLVMDEPEGPNAIYMTANTPIRQRDNAGFINTNIIGQIPVAVFQNNTTITMAIHFTLCGQNFKYESTADFTPAMTARSLRTVLLANFRDASAVSRITAE